MDKNMTQPNTLDADLAVIAQATIDKNALLAAISIETDKLTSIKKDIIDAETLYAVKLVNIESATQAQNVLNQKYDEFTTGTNDSEEKYNEAKKKESDAVHALEIATNDHRLLLIKQNDESDALKAEKERELNSLNDKLVPLKSQESQLIQSIQQKNSLVLSIQDSIDSLQPVKDQLTIDISTLNTEKSQIINDVSQKRAELGTVINTINTSNIQLNSLNVEIGSKNKELETTKERLNEAEIQMLAYARTRAEFEGRVTFIKEQFKKAGVPWPVETENSI